MKQITYLSVIVIFLGMAGCKPAQSVHMDIGRAQPAAFGSKGDSASAGAMSPAAFFSSQPLIDLIDTALVNNWDVQAALQRIQAAQADVLLARASLKPAVDVGVAGSLRKFGLYTMDGAGNRTTDMYDGKLIPEHLPDLYAGLQTSWEVDLWGKLKNRKRAALARFLASVEGRHLVTTGIITELATAYYELLALDETIHILDETLVIQERAYEIIKVQKQAAVTNELAVKQFEAQLKGIKATRYATLQEIAETENYINLLAGRYPQPIVRDTAFFHNAMPVLLQVGVPASLLANRPDIRMAELEVQAARADVSAAKAAFYPSLNISGTLGFQAFKTSLLFRSPESIAYGVLGSLTAPLLNKAAIKAAFQTATAVQLEALFNYQKSIVTAYVEVYNEVLRFGNLQQVYTLKSDQAGSLAQSINIAGQLFRTGRVNYLEVLFAQQNALEVKLQLIDARKRQLLTTVNLYKALGGGWR